MSIDLQIVTCATKEYRLLLPLFIRTITEIYDISIVIVTLSEDEEALREYVDAFNLPRNVKIHALPPIALLPQDAATQGCALKLRVWDVLPPSTYRCLFLDVDIVLVTDICKQINPEILMSSGIIAVRDEYIGYKEKMAEEFAPLGHPWVPHFDADGNRLYCNTGLLISSRHHALFFAHVLRLWSHFVDHTGNNPSIWDQNIFNYCLDLPSAHSPCTWRDMVVLNPQFNALKEYPIYIDLDRGVTCLKEQPVYALHFNGGNLVAKYARRARTLAVLSDCSTAM